MSLLVTALLEAFVNASTGLTGATGEKHNRLLGLVSLAITRAGGLKTQLNVISVAIVVIYAVRGLFYYGQTVFFAEAGQRLGLSLRNDVYRHLQGLSLSFFNRQRTGALMSTINNDVPLLQGSMSGLKDLAPAPFTILGGVWIIFHISPQLSCAALLAVPAMVYSIGRLSRMVRSTTSRTQDKLADVNTLMEETFSGIRIIQSFGAEKYSADRFRLENGLAKDLAMRVIRQAAKLKPVTDVIGAAGIALALWFAGRLIISHELTLGELVQFIYVQPDRGRRQQSGRGESHLGADPGGEQPHLPERPGCPVGDSGCPRCRDTPRSGRAGRVRPRRLRLQPGHARAARHLVHDEPRRSRGRRRLLRRGQEHHRGPDPALL